MATYGYVLCCVRFTFCLTLAALHVALHTRYEVRLCSLCVRDLNPDADTEPEDFTNIHTQNKNENANVEDADEAADVLLTTGSTERLVVEESNAAAASLRVRRTSGSAAATTAVWSSALQQTKQGDD